jgi:glycerol kinase
MEQSLGELAVDGGAAASDLLLQAQADSTGLHVRRPVHLESTARGVALLAGLQAGAIADLKDLVPNRTQDSSVFEPLQTLEQRQSWRQRWNDAVSRSLHWNG